MSLNEYRAHIEEEAALKKKGMININTKDVLFSSNKLLIIQLETMAKRLDARKVGQLSATFICDYYEQAYESGVCLPTSLGLLEE